MMNPQYSRLACRFIYSQVYTVINTSYCTLVMRNGWYYSFQLLGLDFPMISVSNLLKILHQNLSRFCIRVSQDHVSDSLKIMCQNLSRSCVRTSQDHVSEPLKIMCQILSRSCIRFSRDIVSKSLKIMYQIYSRSCIRIYQDFVSESLKIMYQILSLDPLSYIKLESKETNPLRNKLFCYIISKIIVVTLFF